MNSPVGGYIVFTGIELAAMISDTFRIHQEFPKEPRKAFRKMDLITPYGVHPTLLAMLVLHEEKMPEPDRIRRAKALLGHDFKEDTTAPLPIWCQDADVMTLIDGLTFTKDQEPAVEMWKRGDDVIITKLYDTVGNLMGVGRMNPDRVAVRRDYARKHVDYVAGLHPELEIVKIGRGLLG